MPQAAVRKPSHVLTTREVARLFETAGVARTERSITNWCLPNRTGIARLDCYFDPNERKYFITPESVNQAIGEEQAKASRAAPQPVPESPASEPPNHSASSTRPKTAANDSDESSDDLRSLRQENLDLKITNRAKDMFIEQLQSERAAFATERQSYIEKLLASNHLLGQFEAKLALPSRDVDREDLGGEERSSPSAASSGT